MARARARPSQLHRAKGRVTMNIVMLCEFFGDGLQYQENLLAKYFVKHGHRVTVITSTFETVADYIANRYDRRAPAKEYVAGGVTVIKRPYSLNIANRLRRLPGVRSILERERADLVFVHDIHLNLGDAVAYKRAHPGCRIVLDYHADYTNSAKNWLSLRVLHGVIRKRFLNRHRRFIDKILPVVPVSAVFLNEVYGVPHAEMQLLPLGADTDVARDAIADQHGRAVRNRLGIPSDAFVVFTGGKLARLKETHVLVDAFMQLSDPRVHLLVVGDDLDSSGYKNDLIARCSGNPRAHFIGWVDGTDVYSYMGACDVAVFPASQSALWQQSLSMGLPLIVGAGTHIGDQDPSYMNICDNVTILPRAEIRADVIARHLRQLLDNPAELARRRAGAFQAANTLFNYDTIVKDVLTFPTE